MEIDKSPVCDMCSKESGLEWKGSMGTTGAYLETVGFIYKNAVLYTGKNTPLAFCSAECQKEYYDNVLKIPQEKIKEVKALMDEVKESINKDIPKIVERLNEVSKAFNKIKTGGV